MHHPRRCPRPAIRPHHPLRAPVSSPATANCRKRTAQPPRRPSLPDRRRPDPEQTATAYQDRTDLRPPQVASPYSAALEWERLADLAGPAQASAPVPAEAATLAVAL